MRYCPHRSTRSVVSFSPTPGRSHHNITSDTKKQNTRGRHILRSRDPGLPSWVFIDVDWEGGGVRDA